MSAVSTITLTSNSAATTAATVLSLVTLPTNCLVLLDVVNYHVTAGSLAAAPVISSTGGETWVLVADVTTGGTPNRRITRWRTMVATDVGSIVTITFAGSQTNITYAMSAYSGVHTSGLWGAGAVGQIVTGNSAGANVTTLTLPLGAQADIRNGLSAFFLSGNAGAMTQRVGWTELYDLAGAAAAPVRLQVQALVSGDTAAVGVGTSATMAGVVCELVASTSPADWRRVYAAQGPGTPAISADNISVLKNRVYLIGFEGPSSGTAAVLTTPGITITKDLDFTTTNGFRQQVWRFKSPADGNILITVTNGIAGYNKQIVVYEGSNIDFTVGGGTGIVTLVTGTKAAPSTSFDFIITPTSRDNPMVMLFFVGAANPHPPVGWQELNYDTGGGSFNPTSAFWRANADDTPGVAYANPTVVSGGALYEFQAAPTTTSGTPPVITLVSPPEGTIGVTQEIVVDYTDVDGDLSLVVPRLNMPTLAITESMFDTALTAFEVAYVGSSRVAIANGFRFTFRRITGWPDFTIRLLSTATDLTGNITTAVHVFNIFGITAGIPGACGISTPTPGPSSPGFPDFSTSQGDCNPVYLTQDDLLALLARLLPTSYLDPIRVLGPGYELFEATTKVFERISLAVGRLECDMFIRTASGGAFATVQVNFVRDINAAGAISVKAGTIIVTSKGGHQFVIQQDAEFTGPGLFTLNVEARAVAQGFEYNQPGQRVTLGGETLGGEIDVIDLPIQNPVYGDPTIRVQHIHDASGGKPAMLDALGYDRGIVRAPGEQDGPYAARVRALPDTVSPDAIVRLLTRLLDPYGGGWQFIETWHASYQTCWDAPSTSFPFPGDEFNPNLFCYDDPRPPTPFRNRWLDEEEQFGTFIVVVPNYSALRDFGMAYDDPADNLAQHQTAIGQRAYSAYDVDFGFAVGLAGAYDGYDIGKAAVYKSIYDNLQETKAGGIVAVVELEGQ